MILLIIILLECGFISAKGLSVIGYVSDSSDDITIPYAQVGITKVGGDDIWTWVLTNEKGEFKFEELQEGSYNIVIQAFSYQKQNIDSVEVSKKETNIGNVSMLKMLNELDEVQVISRKKAIQYKVDRKVINAASFPNADVAIDLLENVPSLQVDYDGNITYRGDGTFSVYINGHPVANGIEKLRQIPTDRIDKIEIITNPSASYSSEGTAGIIQVILKRNRLEGIAISSSIKIDTKDGYDWQYSIDQKGETGGWYVEGNLANRTGIPFARNTIQESYGTNQIDRVISEFETKSTSVSSYIELGFNYDLGSKHYIDFSLYINPKKTISNEDYSAKYIESIIQDGDETIIDTYNLDGTYNLEYGYIGSTLTYEYSLTKDKANQLSLYVDYGSTIGNTDDSKVNVEKHSDYNKSVGFIGSESGEFLIEGNLAYKRKLNDDTKFEIGGNVNIEEIPTLRSANGTYDQDDNLVPFPEEPKEQEVDYKQNIYSAYSTFSSKINKFEYKLGLRGEITDRRSNYSYLNSDNQRDVEVSESRFAYLFPSVHLLYSSSDEQQISLNYSRRVSRASYWNLIPLKSYLEPYRYSIGNGELLPAYTDAIEFAYKYSWESNFIGLEVFDRETSNVMQQYWRSAGDNILIQKWENVGDSRSLGAEVMFSMDLFSWWNVNISTSLYSYTLFVNMEDQKSTESSFRTDSRLNNSITLPKEFSL